MKDIEVRSGQIIGLEHALRQTNCQDSHCVLQTEQTIVGIVCDGCSEGQSSEVGATLGAQFLAAQAVQLAEEHIPLEDIPPLLHERLLGYLENLIAISQPPQRVEFIHQQLLFTVVGMVITPQGGIVFHGGDGLIALDEQAMCINQNNQPNYIAYHLIRAYLPEDYVLPPTFEVYPLEQGWQRVAIATDGFTAELLPNVWGIKHPRGLQRKLNVWANQERRFRDDATVIAVEKVKLNGTSDAGWQENHPDG